jgi:hypothetical protein
MTSDSPQVPVRPSRRKWWALAAGLLVVGGAGLAFGLQSQPRSLAGPTTRHVSPPQGTAGSTKSAPVNVVVAPLKERSTPLTLNIPAIGLSKSLALLGVNANGTVKVPTDIQQPGWYQYGTSPGNAGSAVILGHVDSYRGPAVFFKLRTLVAGDLIAVTMADGSKAEFKVTSIAMYLKTQFPAQLVYATPGGSSLQLVTCGGVFDSHTGHYLSNLVVSSSLFATSPATTPAAPLAATGTTPGL